MKKYSLTKYFSRKTFVLALYLLFFNQSLNASNSFKSSYINSKFDSNTIKLSNLIWEISDRDSKKKESLSPKWQFFEGQLLDEDKDIFIKRSKKINILNRSIVFNDEIIGPDISWIIPSGFSWNKKYKLDLNARGHNTMIPEPADKNFFGWNDGDAIGLISYQFLHSNKSSFGFNIGIRSLYQGSEASGGSTSIGEGVSGGFRWDYALSQTSGIAIGAEQLVHFDNTTDSGRNLYITFSKAWWSSELDGTNNFPLYIATGGLGTGRMAVGAKVKGLCSNLFGDGTDVNNKNRLCWAPVFSLAGVWNEKFSTFVEHNNRFILLGNSLAPFKKIPLRGSFALILADHIDNYKVHNFEELNWVFNLSLGF